MQENPSVEEMLAPLLAVLPLAAVASLLIPVAWLWALVTWTDNAQPLILAAEVPVSLVLLWGASLPWQAVTPRRWLRFLLGLGIYVSVGFLYASVAAGLRSSVSMGWTAVLLWPGELVSALMALVLS